MNPIVCKAYDLSNNDSMNNNLNIENDNFRIKFPGRTFNALKSKMETSRHFKNYLTFKEKEEQYVFIEINSYEISPNMIDLLQFYLEGKDFKELVKIEDVHEIYNLHQIFDIPEVIVILHEKIDFYTGKLLDWEGEKFSTYDFWMKIAEIYQDKNLKTLCKQKFFYMKDLITLFEKYTYKENNEISKNCEIYFCPVDSQSIHLKILLKEQVTWIHSYENPISNVINKIKKINFKYISVNIDKKNINKNYENYISEIISFIFKDLTIQTNIIIKNSPVNTFITQNLSKLKFNKLILKNDICESPSSFISFCKSLNDYCKDLNSETGLYFLIQATASFKKKDDLNYNERKTYTINVNIEPQAATDLNSDHFFSLKTINFPSNFPYNELSYLSSLYIYSDNLHDEVASTQWNNENIKDLNINQLTIENCRLTALFIDLINFRAKNNFPLKNLTKLIFLNCTFDLNKKLIQKSLNFRNKLQLIDPEDNLTEENILGKTVSWFIDDVKQDNKNPQEKFMKIKKQNDRILDLFSN